MTQNPVSVLPCDLLRLMWIPNVALGVYWCCNPPWELQPSWLRCSVANDAASLRLPIVLFSHWSVNIPSGSAVVFPSPELKFPSKYLQRLSIEFFVLSKKQYSEFSFPFFVEPSQDISLASYS